MSGKPLSIAFEEIAAGKATYTRPDPEEEAALAAAVAEAAEAGLLAEARRSSWRRRGGGRSDRGARRRGRGPDRELDAGAGPATPPMAGHRGRGATA